MYFYLKTLILSANYSLSDEETSEKTFQKR